MSKFCTSCGVGLSPSAKFCADCGTAVLGLEHAAEVLNTDDRFACPTCGEAIPRGEGQCPHCDSQVGKNCHACHQSMDPDLETCPHCATSIYKSCPHCGGRMLHDANYCKQCKRWLNPVEESEDLKSLKGCMSIVLSVEIFLLAFLVGYMRAWEEWKIFGLGLLVIIIYQMSSTLRAFLNFLCSGIWAFVLMNLSPVIFGKENQEQFLLRMLLEDYSWGYWYIGLLTFFVAMALHQFAREKL